MRAVLGADKRVELGMGEGNSSVWGCIGRGVKLRGGIWNVNW